MISDKTRLIGKTQLKGGEHLSGCGTQSADAQASNFGGKVWCSICSHIDRPEDSLLQKHGSEGEDHLFHQKIQHFGDGIECHGHMIGHVVC